MSSLSSTSSTTLPPIRSSFLPSNIQYRFNFFFLSLSPLTLSTRALACPTLMGTSAKAKFMDLALFPSTFSTVFFSFSFFFHLVRCVAFCHWNSHGRRWWWWRWWLFRLWLSHPIDDIKFLATNKVIRHKHKISHLPLPHCLVNHETDRYTFLC